MITVAAIRPLLNGGVNHSSFLDVHYLTEAYIRRVVYLGCRNHNFSHDDAQHIATYQFISGNRLYTTLFELLSGSANLARTLRRNHPDFNILIELYEDYSCVYRNRLVHGAVTLSPGAFEDLLRHIDISFACEFDRVLVAHFGHSALDTPQAWGFQTGQSSTGFPGARQRMSNLARRHNWSKTFAGERLLNTSVRKISVTARLKRTQYPPP